MQNARFCETKWPLRITDALASQLFQFPSKRIIQTMWTILASWEEHWIIEIYNVKLVLQLICKSIICSLSSHILKFCFRQVNHLLLNNYTQLKNTCIAAKVELQKVFWTIKVRNYLNMNEFVRKCECWCTEVNLHLTSFPQVCWGHGLDSVCDGRLLGVVLLLAGSSLRLGLGSIRGLQHISAKNNCVINNVMVIHTKIVLFQYHMILLNSGSSDSRIRGVSYNSGIPVPGWNSALCSIITFKQEVGTSRSTKPLNFTFRVWVSDTYPTTIGATLKKVKRWRTGSLLNFNMVGWLELERVSPLPERNSTLTFKTKTKQVRQTFILYWYWKTNMINTQAD